jgi:dTDP-4-amino-4,6-dideoxygalactose transaminase
MIGFNKPHITGNEFTYINEAIKLEKISGNGEFTKRCQSFFETRYKFKKCLLTHSCTAALEMAAILANIKEGDEVIMPSYTFVSTANAFLLRGASVVFCDSSANNPNISVEHLKKLITQRTKAIVVVHYAGVGCDIEDILKLAQENNVYLIEDAAQAIDSYYNGKPLGSFGHFAAFSFHETKNIIAGEGGMLVVNDDKFVPRAEIIWEKGTNRVAYFRNEISKYNWIDIGSSFLPSELTAAFLFAQLESIDVIQKRRKELWDYYYASLQSLADKGVITLPEVMKENPGNSHIFYILTKTPEARNSLLSYLGEKRIQAIFHYLCLHQSPFFRKDHPESGSLPNAEFFSSCLIRLPLYFDLDKQKIDLIAEEIFNFYYQ